MSMNYSFKIAGRIFHSDSAKFDQSKLQSADKTADFIIDAKDFHGNELHVAETYVAAAFDPAWKKFAAKNFYAWVKWAQAFDAAAKLLDQIYQSPSAKNESTGCNHEGTICAQPYTTFTSQEWKQVLPAVRKLETAKAQICAGAKLLLNENIKFPEEISAEHEKYAAQYRAMQSSSSVYDFRCRGRGCPGKNRFLITIPCT